MNYREVREGFLSKSNVERVFVGDIYGSIDIYNRDKQSEYLELEEQYNGNQQELLHQALLHLFNYDNEQNVFLGGATSYQSRSIGLLGLEPEQITKIHEMNIKLLEIDGKYYVSGDGNHRTFALCRWNIYNNLDCIAKLLLE